MRKDTASRDRIRRLRGLVLGLIILSASDAAAATLAWDPNVEPDIAYYTVHWGTAASSLPNTVNVGNLTSWVFTPPDATIAYYFAVRAVNTSGIASPLSSVVSLPGIALPPPLPPSTRNDINSDGYADILWQHQGDGGLVAWTMAGIVRRGAAFLNPQRSSDLTWQVVALADFNQDRLPDLLWQHQLDGRLLTWNMQGMNMTSVTWLNPAGVADPDWRVAGTGDFNGDSWTDLLWQHRVNGGLVMWLMNGTNMTSAQWLTPSSVADQGWRVSGVADFNRDGKHDLLWRHQTNGSLVAWMMNGASMVSAEWLNPTAVSDPNWRVAATKDFNNDGSPDILWQHQVTGKLNMWYLNRLNLLSAPWLVPDAVTDTAWKVIGAH